MPIVVGFTVSRILAEPFYEVAQRYNPQVFAVSDREKVGQSWPCCLLGALNPSMS